MSDIVRRDSLPLMWHLPTPPGRFAHYLEPSTLWDMQMAFEPLAQSWARVALADMQPMFSKPTDKLIAAWIAPVLSAVRNTGNRSPEETKAWFQSLMLACGDIPACLFNQESQKRALRTFEFFPAVSDVWNLLNADLFAMKERRRALKRIIEGPTEP